MSFPGQAFYPHPAYINNTNRATELTQIFWNMREHIEAIDRKLAKKKRHQILLFVSECKRRDHNARNMEMYFQQLEPLNQNRLDGIARARWEGQVKIQMMEGRKAMLIEQIEMDQVEAMMAKLAL